MPSAHINPQAAKRALHDAHDIGKESGSSPIFPFVAVSVDTDLGFQAYGRSQYCVGWSYTTEPITATHDNTVLLGWDEAKDLGMAVGKTSAAKDATVWIEVTDGRLLVAYGEEPIADLPGIEPEDGDIEGVNEDLAIINQAQPEPRQFLALTSEVVKRFTKVRGKSPILDFYLTSLGNTVLVKVGDTFMGAFEAVDRSRVEQSEEYLF